jgi:adenine-specific DNA methylase
MTKRMIETSFPVIEISRLAIPERSSYKPIYQISKWFARRSSAVFRAILLSACYNSSKNFMKQFYEEENLSNVTLLDPFMGGGTTIVEGLRLGMNCIGVDLNPIAWFITKTESEMVDLTRLQGYIDRCCNEIENKVKKWYKTNCPVCNKQADIIYTHWVKLLPCPSCKTSIPLFRNFFVTSLADDTYYICPSCFLTFSSTTELKGDVSCPHCDFQIFPHRGFRRGRSSCICPSCNESVPILDTIRKGKTILSGKPFAIEGYCPQCENESDGSSLLAKSRYKFVKSIDSEDLILYNDAEKTWNDISYNHLWPKGKIPHGTTTTVLYNHNYYNWSDMFNSRQLLALSSILNYIHNISEYRYQEMLLAAFLGLLNHNNVFTRYSPKGQKVEGIFARHDYHPLSTYAENNVWGTKYGRGTWIKCLRRLISGKAYNISPYNFQRIEIKGKTAKRIKIKSGKIDGKVHNDDLTSFPNKMSNLILLCQDSENIPPFKNSVDIIVTDPPYADNVNYSELSDFFYVWLKLILQKRYSFFMPSETPKIGEAIETKIRKGDYYKKLAAIFTRAREHLKSNGLFIFTFHHANPDTWFNLAEVIVTTGFKVVTTYIMPSEALNVLNIQNKKAVTLDLIIVCKKDLEFKKQEKYLPRFSSNLLNEYKKRIDFYSTEGVQIQGINVIVAFFGVFLEQYSDSILIDESGNPLEYSRITKDCKELFYSHIINSK